MGSHASVEAKAVLEAIRRIVQLLRRSAREAEMRTGLSSAQLFVLQQLRSASGPLTPGELAQRTLTHQSSVSAVLRRLAEAGLVKKATSRRDRRRSELRLTGKGERAVRGAPALAQEQLIGAVERLPPASRAQLAQGLVDLTMELGISAANPPMFFEEAKSRAQ